MTLLGELRIPALRDNLVQVTYFTHGIGHRLYMAEDALIGVEHAVENAVLSVINGPQAPDELSLYAEAVDSALRITIGDLPVPVDFRPIIEAVDTDSPPLMDEAEIQVAPGGRYRLVLVKNIAQTRADRLQPSAVRELDALQTVTQVMATSTDLDSLLRLIVDKLVEAIDVERGTLYLIDPETNTLYSKVLLEDSGVLSEIRIRVGQGIAGHVAATGEVVNIQHAHSDKRFNPAFDRATGFLTKTVLAAPMRNPKGEIIGVVQVLNKIGGPFTARDERMLVAMAAQAAISIETARLHEQVLRQSLLEQELITARSIQQSFLPSSLPQHPAWEIAAYWTPARDVAGDFYDFHLLDDGRWAFVIADVSGKSIPAALFMALAVTVMRFALTLNFPPGALLRNTNRSLCSFNQQSQMFASIFVAYLDFNTGQAECSSAGHNPPLLYCATTRTCEFVKIPGVIAGMFEDLEFAVRPLQMAVGDVLVLYTDGITEAMNSQNEEFTEKRLAALLAENASRPTNELLAAIINAVASHSGGRGAFDDETLVIIKRLSESA